MSSWTLVLLLASFAACSTAWTVPPHYTVTVATAGDIADVGSMAVSGNKLLWAFDELGYGNITQLYDCEASVRYVVQLPLKKCVKQPVSCSALLAMRLPPASAQKLGKATWQGKSAELYRFHSGNDRTEWYMVQHAGYDVPLAVVQSKLAIVPPVAEQSNSFTFTNYNFSAIPAAVFQPPALCNKTASPLPTAAHNRRRRPAAAPAPAATACTASADFIEKMERTTYTNGVVTISGTVYASPTNQQLLFSASEVAGPAKGGRADYYLCDSASRFLLNNVTKNCEKSVNNAICSLVPTAVDPTASSLGTMHWKGQLVSAWQLNHASVITRWFTLPGSRSSVIGRQQFSNGFLVPSLWTQTSYSRYGLPSSASIGKITPPAACNSSLPWLSAAHVAANKVAREEAVAGVQQAVAAATPPALPNEFVANLTAWQPSQGVPKQPAFWAMDGSGDRTRFVFSPGNASAEVQFFFLCAESMFYQVQNGQCFGAPMNCTANSTFVIPPNANQIKTGHWQLDAGANTFDYVMSAATGQLSSLTWTSHNVVPATTSVNMQYVFSQWKIGKPDSSLFTPPASCKKHVKVKAR